jgi:2-oxoglutarate ferredoxin oxidoreductase subunit gamma
MINRIICAGSGGQGIMFMGRVLAEAAMRQGLFVTCLPAYGAEVRGGTANCMVNISDTEINSPFIEKARNLIIMNQPSLERFKTNLEKKGLIILNSSLASVDNPIKACVISHPFTAIAQELGSPKVANMAAVGCFAAKTKIVSIDIIRQVINDFWPSDKGNIIRLNQEALSAGFSLR